MRKGLEFSVLGFFIEDLNVVKNYILRFKESSGNLNILLQMFGLISSQTRPNPTRIPGINKILVRL